MDSEVSLWWQQSDSLLSSLGQRPGPEAHKALSDLRQQLNGLIASLPSYEQRRATQRISELEDKLAGSSQPRQRLAFGRQPATSAPLPPPKVDDPSTSTTDLATVREGLYLTFKELSVASGGILNLAELRSCIVDLLSLDTLASVHLKQLEDTVILLGSVQGSVLVEDCRHCSIVCRAQQMRIHRTERTDFRIDVKAAPITEDSADLRFASYPPSLDRSDIASATASAPLDFSDPLLRAGGTAAAELPDLPWPLTTTERLDVAGQLRRLLPRT